MTTSGSITFNPTRDQVIRRALRLVGAYASTDNPRPEQITDANEVLNMLLKSWQVDEGLWLLTHGVLFLNKGQREYNLAPSTYSGFSHCALGEDDYVQTNLSGATLAAATSVVVNSTTGISNGDFVGVANSYGTIEWFYASVSNNTISLFTDSGLTTPGTMSAAALKGGVVYSHTVASQIPRPPRVDDIRRKYYDVVAKKGYEIQIEMVSHDEYESLPDKWSAAKVVQAYYDPQLVCGKLSVWPTADDPGDKLILTFNRPICDMLTESDTFDLPQEWARAIAYGLAVELAPEYGLPINERMQLAQMYAAVKASVEGFNHEPVSTKFEIDFRR